jgi:energy-coupling factor transporter ATP-binding protein EcfA2
MLVGREREITRLCEAIKKRQSLLIYGSAGSGKSALLETVLSGFAPTARQRFIVAAAAAAPVLVWQNIVLALSRELDPEVLRRVEEEAGSERFVSTWIVAQTSLRLRGVLRHAARLRDYSIFLDARTPLPDGVYRLLQEWIWSGRTPVVLLARGSTRPEIGKVAQLYWHDGLRLAIRSLDPASAEILLDQTIMRCGLAKSANADFREFVLNRSGRLPGPLIRLCELASQPAYQYDGQIKLHSLSIDFMLEELKPAQQNAHHV